MCRFAVGSFGVEDLAQSARAHWILKSTPASVGRVHGGGRAALQRTFEAWRLAAAEQSGHRRRARHSPFHLIKSTGAQLSGHISYGEHLNLTQANEWLLKLRGFLTTSPVVNFQ